MAFLDTLRSIAFRQESSPYTYPQADLAVSDADFKAFNIKYSASIEEVKRLFASGDMSRLTSIMGKRSGTVSFSVYLAWSGTVTVAPEWAKLLLSCGWEQTAHGSTGISWTPSSRHTNVPSVIEVRELSEGATPTQLCIRMRGCMGNVQLVLDNVGNAFRADFNFTGVIQEIEDVANANIVLPASYDTTQPSAVLGATITAFDEALDLDALTIDMQNKVELFPDPAASEGFSGAHITDRDPTLSVNPYLGSLSAQPYWTRMIAGSTGVLAVEIGTNLSLSAPAIQCVDGYKGGSRTGAAVNDLKFNFTRSAGDDEIEILQGSKT